jgi:hypothetical protein
MITKRRFIELVQDRLAGGDATMDVQGKYAYTVIEEAINMVFSDIVSKDRYLAKEMAITYDQLVVCNKTLLSARPILGMKGIVWIEDSNGVNIPSAQGFEENKIMDYIMPQVGRKATNITGSYLFFKGVTTSNIQSVEIIITMIPNIKDLDEDDNLIVEDKFTQMYDLVRQIVEPNKPQDILDNNVPDTDKGK